MTGSSSPIFDRNVPGSTEILQKATVGIAGCGGLGSNAAVALVRAGVGRLILVDFDRVEESNLNRQYYFQKDIGRFKVEALAVRLLEINPHVILIRHPRKLMPEDILNFFNEADLLIEAFDNAQAKHWLIEAWSTAYPERAIVVGSGLAGIGCTSDLKVHRAGHIIFCGDESTDMSVGLCASRVAITANMQANVAIALLTGAKVI